MDPQYMVAEPLGRKDGEPLFRFNEHTANHFMQTWWRVRTLAGATICYMLDEDIAKEVAGFLNREEVSD